MWRTSNMRHLILTAVALLFLGGCSEPDRVERFSLAENQHPFIPVMINDADAAQRNGFPLDRAVVAMAVRNAAEAGARGVILKFFYDRESTSGSDARLAESFDSVPVLLQAALNESESSPNPLPGKFARNGVDLGSFSALDAESGWIPIAELSHNAVAVGFADVADPHTVPAFVVYQGSVFPSLTLASLEMAFESHASLTSNGSLELAGYKLDLDDSASFRIRLPQTEYSDFVPFHSLVEGELPADLLEGKIVVIGYDGSRMSEIPTDIGVVKAHRLFYYGLVSTYLEISGSQ